jgi:hypothetical protein
MDADIKRLREALQENLSPETICLIAAYLQPGTSHSGGGEEGEAARAQLEWFHDQLVEMLGVKQMNEMMEVVGV